MMSNDIASNLDSTAIIEHCGVAIGGFRSRAMQRPLCLLASILVVLVPGEVNAMEKPLLKLTKKTQAAGEVVVAGQPVETPAYDYGELVFANRFPAQVDLLFNIGPDQNFVPIVRSAGGEVVSNGKPFGFSRTPSREFLKISVPAGESFTCELRNLLETVSEEKQLPGTYYVRVRFERDSQIWESNEIEVSLK